MQFIYTTSNVEHNADSHKKNKCKYLNASQKLDLEMFARIKPSEILSTIRCGASNLAEEQRVGPKHARAVGNLVRETRRQIVDDKLKSAHPTGPKRTQDYIQSICQGPMFLQVSQHAEESNLSKWFVPDIKLLPAYFMSAFLRSACYAIFFNITITINIIPFL